MWNIVKWPIMLLVVFLVAVLYYATPNVKQPKFRWVSVGAGLAIVVWIVASAACGGTSGSSPSGRQSSSSDWRYDERTATEANTAGTDHRAIRTLVASSPAVTSAGRPVRDR